MLGKLGSSLYRFVRHASEDAARNSVVPEIGESKRLLAEFIDSRIELVQDAIGASAPTGARVAELQREALTYVAQELRQVAHEVRQVHETFAPKYDGLVDGVARGDASVIDAEIAALLNVAQSHTGPLAAEGLFLNPPVHPEWRAGGVRLAHVTERIAELPFVMGALGALPWGSRILDIGCAESTLALTLATLGHKVTAVDPRGYPFSHPNLTVLRQRIDQVSPADHEPFDAVVSLSAVEHFGLASYDGDVCADDADRRAIVRAGELLKADGLLVLTAPYGRPHLTDLERVYGPDELTGLLDGWKLHDRLVLHQADDVTWLPGEELDGNGCVLIAGRREAPDR